MKLRLLSSMFLLAAVAVSMGAATVDAGAAKPVTLVELYTSQGCSSCPPAERFSAELDKRDDVVVLTMHVNYWDYIGWRDPFASDETTDRQRAYGRRLARGMVYTPQMVIDGVHDAVGSDRYAVNRAIAEARRADRLRLDIDVRSDGDGGLVVSLPGGHFDGAAIVWLARFDAEQKTSVTRGENTGRTLRTVNVVRDLRRIGSWTGAPVDFHLPASLLTAGEGGRDGCAIIVQAEGPGAVLGVHKMALTAGGS